jgi:hypothetical protein
LQLKLTGVSVKLGKRISAQELIDAKYGTNTHTHTHAHTHTHRLTHTHTHMTLFSWSLC